MSTSWFDTTTQHTSYDWFIGSSPYNWNTLELDMQMHVYVTALYPLGPLHWNLKQFFVAPVAPDAMKMAWVGVSKVLQKNHLKIGIVSFLPIQKQRIIGNHVHDCQAPEMSCPKRF